MPGFDTVHFALDPILIFMFRLPADPYVGFALGLAWCGLLATMVGELTLGAVYAFNRKYFAESAEDMARNHNLAVRALACKDKDSYKACNGLANDAFGKSFFSHIALFASSLWPVPFMLGWLDFRFGNVDFVLPYLGSVGPAFAFIPAYILVRVAFSRIKTRLPVFGRIKKMVDEVEHGQELLSYADIPTMGRKSSAAGTAVD